MWHFKGRLCNRKGLWCNLFYELCDFSSKLGTQMSFKAICEENTKELVMFNECL